MDKIHQIQENSQISKSIHRSTSHVCNATFKKTSEKSFNEISKNKTNISFKTTSNILLNNHNKGFLSTFNSNFNHFNKSTFSKFKLEPLTEKKVNDFNSEISSNKAQEEPNNSCKLVMDNQNENKENLILSENQNEITEKDSKDNNVNIKNNDNSIDKNILIVNNNDFNSPIFHSTKNIALISNPLNTESNNENKKDLIVHSSKNLFNIAKKEKQLLGIKTESELNKPLGETQMPLISVSSKNQNEINNDNNDNNVNHNNLSVNTNANLNKENNKDDFILNNNNNNTQNNFATSTNKLYNFNAVFNDKLKIKIIEKDIEKKVESYKIKLNSDMLKILREEKQKEEEREAFYSKANSEVERKRLENMIALERVQSSQRILKINE